MGEVHFKQKGRDDQAEPEDCSQSSYTYKAAELFGVNVDELMNLRPLEDKWKSFGWETIYEKDGNNIKNIIDDFNELEKISDKPKCIISNTLKNNGVPSWEKEHIHHIAGKKLFDGLVEGRKLLKNE